jgi:hypothetical protein
LALGFPGIRFCERIRRMAHFWVKENKLLCLDSIAEASGSSSFFTPSRPMAAAKSSS